MNTAALIKMAVKEVFVHWSESRILNKELGCDALSDIKKAFPLDQFEDACVRAAAAVETGYDKTKFDVIWQDGSADTFRIDLSRTNKSPIAHIQFMISQ